MRRAGSQVTNFQTQAAQAWVSHCPDVEPRTTWLFLTEQAMNHNQDRLTAFRENQARTNILNKEVQHLQEEKSKQVSVVPSLALDCSQLSRSASFPPGLPLESVHLLLNETVGSRCPLQPDTVDGSLHSCP